MSKILIIEDERHTADTITLYLERQGFECLKAYDGSEGISTLLQNEVDLIVLDWMLPGLTGIEICQVAKSMRKVKVIMLSARSSVADKITGLEIGADDYLAKPFSLRELNARIRTLLRHTYSFDENAFQENVQAVIVQELKAQFADGVLVINKQNFSATFNDVELALTMSEFKILYLLTERVSHILTREDIANVLYGTEATGHIQTITVHLSNLRMKLRELTRSAVIKTVYGLGYKLDGVTNLQITRT